MIRILAIEPNPERGALLRRLVRDAVGAEVMPVTSTKAALAAIESHQPDVILTSSILSPQDEGELVSHLRRTPALRHLPVLTVPPVMQAPVTDNSLLTRLRLRRRQPAGPAYDFSAVVSRIEDAIEDSRFAAQHSDRSAANVELTEFAPQTAAATAYSRRPVRQRKRARRWEGWQLPWLSTVKLPSGFELRLVNISNSGLLVESHSRIPMGTATSFDLWGPYRKLTIPARIVRSDIGVVDAVGVRYHAAAVFDHAIDTLMPADEPVDVATLLDELVDKLLDRARLGADPRELRGEFEAGVMALVSIRDVRLRDAPSATEHGPESIYFTIPDATAHAVLQVTFDSGYQPRQEDFDALKAASAAAARVLGVIEPLRLFPPEPESAHESRPTA
jgi:CheY-like chemotaxis protein